VTVYQIILTLNIFVWLLPPIKQFGGRYFYYFLILALSDPLNIAIRYLFHFTFYLHLILDLFLILSLFDFRMLKNIPFVLLLILFSVGSNIFLTPDSAAVLMIICDLIILTIFLKRTVLYLHDYGSINLFFFVLILYETSAISKYLILLFELPVKIIYFNLTTAFEILIALYFTFFTTDNSPKIPFHTGLKNK